ncbi:TlpA family protein disulfide reductase [Saccharicrinis sp. FJH2]|uniref:TlpA family protein disulfide reductase n=1 Tax=Saccharicrinis sp. FJH65 TaxID=3344659 RepID=UPI0035F48AB0
MNHNNLTKSIVILFCFLIACTVKNKPEKTEMENNQITLIFKKPPPNWRVYKINQVDGPYTPARCEINFIDDNFIPIQFFPNSEHEFDTLIVKTKRKVVEFRHTYKGIDKLSYFFHNGDSVLFTYNDKTPVASVLNRQSKTHDVNLDLFIKETLYPNDYSSETKYRQPFLFMNNTKDLQKELDRVVALADANLSSEMNTEINLIDSLYQNDLISTENYNLTKTQYIYQKKLIELFKINGGPRPARRIIPKLTKENFNIQLGYDIELGFLDGGNILDSKNDSSLYFGFQKDIIDWIYYNYLSRKVGSISSTHYINGIASAGGSIPDYLSLYDSIQACSMLSQQTKNILKFKTVQNIIENYTIDEAKKAFNQFKIDVKDTALINFINIKYSLPTDISVDSYDLELNSFYSETITFNDLLKKHKGKVVYLDFWSSGCPPCIKQFEHAKKLEALYHDKDLVQIYVSSEPNKQQWEKACRRFDIINESYFVTNRFTSKQLENMDIKFIPRYMLFDKNGKMVIEAAPRPNDKDLIEVIDKYLDGK